MPAVAGIQLPASKRFIAVPAPVPELNCRQLINKCDRFLKRSGNRRF